jgi:hypothetical protein
MQVNSISFTGKAPVFKTKGNQFNKTMENLLGQSDKDLVVVTKKSKPQLHKTMGNVLGQTDKDYVALTKKTRPQSKANNESFMKRAKKMLSTVFDD